MQTVSKREMKKFGFTMATAIAIVFGLLLPWLLEYHYPLWPWIASGSFLLVAIFAPVVLTPVHAVWMKLGHVLGWINSRIILGLMFYTLFFFIALILKLLGKDPMSRKFDNSLDSYRVPAVVRERNHLEKPF